MSQLEFGQGEQSSDGYRSACLTRQAKRGQMTAAAGGFCRWRYQSASCSWPEAWGQTTTAVAGLCLQTALLATVHLRAWGLELHSAALGR